MQWIAIKENKQYKLSFQTVIIILRSEGGRPLEAGKREGGPMDLLKRI